MGDNPERVVVQAPAGGDLTECRYSTFSLILAVHCKGGGDDKNSSSDPWSDWHAVRVHRGRSQRRAQSRVQLSSRLPIKRPLARRTGVSELPASRRLAKTMRKGRKRRKKQHPAPTR